MPDEYVLPPVTKVEYIAPGALTSIPLCTIGPGVIIGIVLELPLRIFEIIELICSPFSVIVGVAKGADSVVVPAVEFGEMPRRIRCNIALSTPSAPVLSWEADFRKQLPLLVPVA